MIRLDGGQVLHTHMRMTGSWHVYPAGHPWRRPERQARLTLTCGDRVAVCFNAPVVELLRPGAERRHPSLAGLGPDVLHEDIDLDEVRRRARAGPPTAPSASCSSTSGWWPASATSGGASRSSPRATTRGRPLSAITDDQLDALVATAGRLMRRAVESRTGVPTAATSTAGRDSPAARCRTPIRSQAPGRAGPHRLLVPDLPAGPAPPSASSPPREAPAVAVRIRVQSIASPPITPRGPAWAV